MNFNLTSIVESVESIQEGLFNRKPIPKEKNELLNEVHNKLLKAFNNSEFTIKFKKQSNKQDPTSYKRYISLSSVNSVLDGLAAGTGASSAVMLKNLNKANAKVKAILGADYSTSINDGTLIAIGMNKYEGITVETSFDGYTGVISVIITIDK